MKKDNLLSKRGGTCADERQERRTRGDCKRGAERRHNGTALKGGGSGRTKCNGE